MNDQHDFLFFKFSNVRRMIMSEKEVLVKLRGINKQYGTNQVVKDLNLDIYKGEFLTLLGPSGCGKTTTLRMIAGFETPSSGEMTINGEDLINKEPFDRNINTVFQSYALFPHMSIYDNIAFGLKMKNMKKADIKPKVEEILELVQLTGFGGRFPHQLSGGQRQRIAIARALVNNPQVLLLDEPLGALDLKLRKQMQVELKRMQKKLGITFVYVTHDQEEALTMSDRIVVMNSGYLEQLGTPDEIYEKPRTKFVATFIGETNLFEATIAQVDEDEVLLNFETGCMRGLGKDFELDEIVYASVRPEKMNFGSSNFYKPSMPAVVKEHIYIGSIVKCIAMLPNGQEVKIQRLSGEPLPKPNEVINLYWEPEDATIMHSREDTLFSLIENVNLGGAYDDSK
ncbi:MAG: polyamine-transporting ATPase/adenosinetriphosphatase [Clostridia bacterium]|nr:polyamine-transporting ATPase/adenosinetriphosphatase [Clostridia bacterium]